MTTIQILYDRYLVVVSDPKQPFVYKMFNIMCILSEQRNNTLFIYFCPIESCLWMTELKVIAVAHLKSTFGQE